MSKVDIQNRSPQVVVLPDERLRVTRVADILNYTSKDVTKFLADLKLPWGTPDPTYPDCLLVQQTTPGQNENPAKNPNDPPPQLIRVYEQIDENSRTMVGEPGISFDQYGRKTVVIEYLQFSSGTTPYTDVVGSTTAPAPNAACVLKTVESTNDGTLIRTKLTFIDSGQLADNIELRFGGKVLERELVYLNEIPPAPSGYSYIGTSIEYIEGLPLYRAKYVAAAGSGGTPGTSGEISDDTTYSQSDDEGVTGVTVRTIRYVSPLSVVVNPIPTPAGFVLIETGFEDEAGIRMWTGRFARGRGTVVDEVTINQTGVLVTYRKVGLDSTPSAPSPTIGGTVVQIATETRKADGYDITEVRWAEGEGLALDETTIQQKDALVVYHRISLGVVPTTPSATIGGTVTLFESSERQEAGYTVYDYRWAEGDGQASITSEGQPDGSRIYTVTTYSAAASIPAYPGGGIGYNTRLSQQPKNGYFENTAVWIRPPDDDTYSKTVEFEEPGIAEFTGTPPQLVFRPPKQRTLLADVDVTYGTTQITTAPFEVEAYATFYETYTPTDTGIAVQNQKGLGGYLAQASGESGTNDIYNGVLCDSFDAVLLSSIPSTFPSGLVTLKVDNDPYLTDINGVKVYRRTVISYTF